MSDDRFWQQLPEGPSPDPALVTAGIVKVMKVFPGAKLLPALRHDRRGRKCNKCNVETLWSTRERVHLHPKCAGY